jgi:hypothetical protein
MFGLGSCSTDMIKTEITGGPLSGDYSHSGALVNSRLLGPSRPPTSTPGAISPSHLNGHREGTDHALFSCAL